jgi:hypothetical protein
MARPGMHRSTQGTPTTARGTSSAAAARGAAAKELRAALAKVMTPGAISVWLDTPNEGFGGLKPREAIERGESDRLWRMIYELQSGVVG